MQQKYTFGIFAFLLFIASGSGQTVGWCNLQWPPEFTTTNKCIPEFVYARVWVDGITNGGGQGAGIEAWIGYSTTDTNPDTWPEDNWIEAAYHIDADNNDEYRVNLVDYLNDDEGIYYYASRFRYNNGTTYSYGGYNAGGGHFWNGTSNVSGIATVNQQADFCNVQFPKAATINMGQNHTVYAQIYEPGITNAAGQGAGIQAWIGYTTLGENYEPWNDDTGWTWILATYNPGCFDCNGDQNDEYMATFGDNLSVGTYYYASRFQINCNEYSYGGISADGIGNFWSYNDNNNGILTVTCSTAPEDTRTWTGSEWVDNNGDPAATPTSSQTAVFEGNYNTASGNVEACECEISSGAVLKIIDGSYVRIQNNIFVDGEIDIDSQGSLVQVNDLATITLNNTNAKNILSKFTHPLGNWYDYTYWSSPLEDAQIEQALFQADANRRFYFNASQFNDMFAEIGNTGEFDSGQDDIDDDGDDWQLQQTGSMIPGVGYAATHNNEVPFTPLTQYMYVFEGTLADGGAFNTGNINVGIYINESVLYNNWNFIGNPYPSAIDAKVFFDHNASILESVIYLWSHATDADPNASGNQNQNFSQNDYAVINYVGGIAGGEASASGSVIPNEFVPSGQGFFVIGKKSGATSGAAYYNETVFTNSMRVTGNNNQFFRTAQELQPDKLWVNLTSDNGVFNQILVAYIDGATNAYDGMGYDAPRNLSSGVNSILYSIIPDSDKKFAIQGKNPSSLSINEIIPLGFYTAIAQATIYKLSIAQIEGEFLSNNTVYVKDNLLNLYHNLSSADYHFTSETGEFNDRFEIVFQAQPLGIDDAVLQADNLSIIELANGHVKFTIGQNQTIKNVKIFDIQGRLLYNLKGNNPVEVYNLSNLSRSAYIAKVTLSNGQTVTKRAIKQK